MRGCYRDPAAVLEELCPGRNSLVVSEMATKIKFNPPSLVSLKTQDSTSYCGVVGLGRVALRDLDFTGGRLADGKKRKDGLQFESHVTEQTNYRNGADRVAQECGGACDSGVVVVVVVRKLCAACGPTGFSGGSWTSVDNLHGTTVER
jgi:hypothetical protein